ncbi:MAG: bifunctional UDP-3-O-[3-hydroxymyristoyl] N-acetylglucosamine deacetylase/3-hydroxyacyl-ACP dehydratase [Bacteroidia bacterium]
MTIKQTTIQTEVSVSGVGLHSGKTANMTIKPAPDNFGIRFKRIDLKNSPEIKADLDNVIDVSRGTSIEDNGGRVSTVEHVLAALAGMEVDNALIEIDGPEVPILDGSSNPFIELICKAGIEEQKAERDYYVLTENLTYEDTDRKVEMLAVPSEDFRVTVMVDYNSPVLGTQHAALNKIADFKKEIAPCRTFVFLHELENLVKHNLIKGGDLDNAIVLVDRVVSQAELDKLAKLLNKPRVEVKERGILNNLELHFQNEPARHKLLDIVGDFALIGQPIKAHILAARPGHAANVEFAKKIKQLIKRDRLKKAVPAIDYNQQPIYDINQISAILPHKYPFLLIDKIVELTEHHVVGVKNVTMNEWFFQGHFPGNPVMPGVLQIEAMAQTGGILVLNTVTDPENYWTYFIKIEKARFKQRVLPGDTLIFRLELASPLRRGICHMKGVAYVGDKVVMEAEMMAQIVKKS